MDTGLKISVLADNNAERDSHLLAEHGLSLYLECDDIKVLFDTGDTDVYLKNAAKVGIDLQSVDFIAFSHHHYDHAGGLQYFSPSRKTKLVAQKYAFYLRSNYPNNLAEKEIVENFETVSVDAEPFELSQNLIFLGAVPELNNFEKKKNFKGRKLMLPSGELIDDFVEDDTALMYRSSEGIVIITGCSHSGICNIIQYAVEIAEKKWGISKVKAVIGGLHLINSESELLAKIIDFLKSQEITDIYPCHCTDLNAKIALAQGGLRIHEVGTGSVIHF